jgi:hypothetical protein
VPGSVSGLQLHPTDGVGGLLVWVGVALLALAAVVRLLDWGPLSEQPPSRVPSRWLARGLAVTGAALAVGAVVAQLLDL